ILIHTTSTIYFIIGLMNVQEDNNQDNLLKEVHVGHKKQIVEASHECYVEYIVFKIVWIGEPGVALGTKTDVDTVQFFVFVMASNLYIKTKTEFDEYIKTKTEFDEYIKTKTEFDEYIKTKTEFDQVTSELHYKKKTSVIEHEQIISICSIQYNIVIGCFFNAAHIWFFHAAASLFKEYQTHIYSTCTTGCALVAAGARSFHIISHGDGRG
ncbi:hypothetical protein ACJX0J_013705, partial [Zea mays]